MSSAIFVLNTHRWLHETLLEYAKEPEGDLVVVDRREEADLLLFPEPPWPDPEAPDRLTGLRAAELRRLFVFSQHDFPIRWAPGLYASLPRSHGGPSFSGGFYISHFHRQPGGLMADLEAAQSMDPDLLWSFVGTLTNAAVRAALECLTDERGLVRDTQHFTDVVRWGWQSTHRAEARRAFVEYAELLGRSKFILCPRGRGASSYRLFEALQVGRCPVILSDEWLPPPYVDWETCSLRIPEADVAKLPAILREREGEAELLGRAGREVWERLFAPSRQLATIAQVCADIAPRARTRTRARIAVTTPFVPFAAVRARRLIRRRITRLARR